MSGLGARAHASTVKDAVAKSDVVVLATVAGSQEPARGRTRRGDPRRGRKGWLVTERELPRDPLQHEGRVQPLGGPLSRFSSRAAAATGPRSSAAPVSPGSCSGGPSC